MLKERSNFKVLTPLEKRVLELAEADPGKTILISRVQRHIRPMSFAKACEVIKSLHDKGLIKSNIDQLNISI